MTYSLRFSEKAEKAWSRLESGVREQFRKVLERRLEQPRVPSARLRGGRDVYKIKLRDVGYRLVYQVQDREIVVYVIAVGRRKEVYATLERLFGGRMHD
jgi:mRNA interferase RelE/StbE